jgi:hypothetical protein
MIVVTATPRSGSSLEMLNVASEIGFENIVGDKFPGEYPTPRNKRQERNNTRLQERRPMNPLGFWEDLDYYMKGFSYTLQTHEKFKTLTRQSGKAIKLIATGLVNTNPSEVDRLIICLRDPAATVLSQMDIKSKLAKGSDPTRQVRDYISIAKYVLANPEIPTLTVDYSEHEEDSAKAQAKLAAFLGTAGNASAYVSQKKSSLAERADTDIWEEAYYVYENMLAGNFEAVVEYSEREGTAMSKKTVGMLCERYGAVTNAERCNGCKNIPSVKANLIKFAKHKKLDYKNLPCTLDEQNKLAD